MAVARPPRFSCLLSLIVFGQVSTVSQASPFSGRPPRRSVGPRTGCAASDGRCSGDARAMRAASEMTRPLFALTVFAAGPGQIAGWLGRIPCRGAGSCSNHQTEGVAAWRRAVGLFAYSLPTWGHVWLRPLPLPGTVCASSARPPLAVAPRGIS